MSIAVRYIDLEHIQSVDENEPPPTLALSDNDHFIRPLSHTGKHLMLELLDATDEAEPTGERVFERLGLDYQEARWRDHELFWADADEDEVAEALMRWNSSHSAG